MALDLHAGTRVQVRKTHKPGDWQLAKEEGTSNINMNPTNARCM